jgi:hypothetical protein
MMKMIYWKAEEVISWLGKEDGAASIIEGLTLVYGEKCFSLARHGSCTRSTQGPISRLSHEQRVLDTRLGRPGDLLGEDD